MSLLDRKRRENQASIGKIYAVDRHPCGAGRWKPLHQHVPEQELQQQRKITQHFDIDRSQPRQQPVGRQPRDADHRPQHGRKHDADDRDAQRVDEANDEGAEIGILRAVVDPGVGNRHPGLATEKGKAGRDPAYRQVVYGIRPEPGDDRDRDAHHHDLPDESGKPLTGQWTAQPLATSRFGRGYRHSARSF